MDVSENQIQCQACGAFVGTDADSGELDPSTGRRYCYECGEELPELVAK